MLVGIRRARAKTGPRIRAEIWIQLELFRRYRKPKLGPVAPWWCVPKRGHTYADDVWKLRLRNYYRAKDDGLIVSHWTRCTSFDDWKRKKK